MKPLAIEPARRPEPTAEENLLKQAERWNREQSRRTIELIAKRVVEVGLDGLTDEESGRLQKALADTEIHHDDFARMVDELRRVLAGEAGVNSVDYDALKIAASNAQSDLETAEVMISELRETAAQAMGKYRNAVRAKAQWQAARGHFQHLFQAEG